jgi:uncharacterized membrane protein YdfJ with MMPL/SSD domain
VNLISVSFDVYHQLIIERKKPLKKSTTRILILTIVAVFTLTIFAPLASYASSKGSRNTAIGLGAVAAYLFTRGKAVPGIIAAAGAGYAWNKSQQHDNGRHKARNRHDYKRNHNWNRNRDRGHNKSDYRHHYGYRR